SPRGAGISPRPTTGSHLSPIKSSPVTPFEGTAARRWAFLERRRALTQSLKATSHAVWLWEGLVLRPSLPQASLVRTNRRAGDGFARIARRPCALVVRLVDDDRFPNQAERVIGFQVGSSDGDFQFTLAVLTNGDVTEVAEVMLRSAGQTVLSRRGGKVLTHALVCNVRAVVG